jgi:hypothetical protein
LCIWSTRLAFEIVQCTILKELTMAKRFEIIPWYYDCELSFFVMFPLFDSAVSVRHIAEALHCIHSFIHSFINKGLASQCNDFTKIKSYLFAFVTARSWLRCKSELWRSRDSIARVSRLIN